MIYYLQSMAVIIIKTIIIINCRMSKFNFLFSLYKQVTNATKAGDIPQLTKFLKESEVFKNVAWKIHDMKKNAVSKMDDIAFK